MNNSTRILPQVQAAVNAIRETETNIERVKLGGIGLHTVGHPFRQEFGLSVEGVVKEIYPTALDMISELVIKAYEAPVSYTI